MYKSVLHLIAFIVLLAATGCQVRVEGYELGNGQSEEISELRQKEIEELKKEAKETRAKREEG